MTQAAQATEFCAALLGGHAGDERLQGLSVCVWTLPHRRTQWVRAENPSLVASVVVQEAKRQPGAVHAVYMGFGLVTNETAQRIQTERNSDGTLKGGRAEAGDIAGIPGLWADIDIAGHGHSKHGLPPDQAAAHKILDACGVPPSLIIDTGYGIHAWWALHEPLIFTDDAERREVATFLRAWNMTLKVRAADLGWGAGVDSVYDLPRLMRAPGSWNTKGADGKFSADTADHRPVKILLDSGYRYNLEDFRAYLASDAAISTVSATQVATGDTIPGVDLAAAWRRACGHKERGYVPGWLATILDVDGDVGGKLTDTWTGNRPDLNGDKSGYDAALVRLLHDMGVTTARQVEAVMCLRLRHGHDVDKVNPAFRVDYLIRTVLNVHALAAAPGPVAQKLQAIVERAPEPEPAAPVTAPVVTVGDDRWGTRNTATIEILSLMDDLLIPERYREQGVSVWSLEHRDYGEAQKGRLVLRVPDSFSWPGGGPRLYRVGYPLKCEWLRRATFDDHGKGFRIAMERDAMIEAVPLGNRKAEWVALLRALIPHWQMDSSGSDLASAAKQWLLDFLLTHAPTTVEADAVDLRRSFVSSWTPLTMSFNFAAFAEFVAVQPGAGSLVGRAARSLLMYLAVAEIRPRMSGPDGVQRRRTGWCQIDEGQFTPEEWEHVVEITREAEQARDERALRLVPGGQ